MGNVKNLMHENAIIKMRELAEKAKTCFFQTCMGDFPGHGRPMAIAQIDDEGKLWFFSQASSNKNSEIELDNRVQVIFSKPDSAEFLCVSGEAEIVFDRNRIETFWDPFLRSWFPKGKNDPDISLICVKPIQAYYWDIRHNKAISLLKTKVGALVGMSVDNVVEGALRL